MTLIRKTTISLLSAPHEGVSSSSCHIKFCTGRSLPDFSTSCTKHLPGSDASVAALKISSILNSQGWFPGKQWGYGLARRFIIISTILVICLGIALAAPGQSAQIVVVTGASGVFLSCYLIPIVNHLMLYCGWCALLPSKLTRWATWKSYYDCCSLALRGWRQSYMDRCHCDPKMNGCTQNLELESLHWALRRMDAAHAP